jgi:hypothetical protein
VRSGKPAVSDIFVYFKEHPQETEIFDAGIRSKAQSAISPVLAAYDFSTFETIGDIGGGLGHLLKAILKSSPKSTADSCKVTAFGQPEFFPIYIVFAA